MTTSANNHDSDEPLCLHDTLTATTRRFEPLGSEVKMYVCGITPYDSAHLGHAFTFAAFDVLIRFLRFRGLSVRYVQNVTDVDDPLFEKAKQLGVSYQDLAQEETERHTHDMGALNLISPDVFPRASREVPEMIALVQQLLASGHAYTNDGHVYFSISTDSNYGKLSKENRPSMVQLARARGGDPDDPCRRDPLDFVLWRPSQPDEPEMASPWGPGLPGWHLECSAMSLKYLGAPIDIHGGGNDLIFPHHENEIAQSESVTKKRPFARYWLHTGMVYMDGEKMSKSLGNMVFVRDLLPEFGANAVRLYLAGCHYRERLYYDSEQLPRAAALADFLETAAGLSSGKRELGFDISSVHHEFVTRMNDDLDTPGAIAVLRNLAGDIQHGSADGQDVSGAQASLIALGALLGLVLDPDRSS